MNKKGAWGPAPTMLDWTAFIVLIIVIILAIIIFGFVSSQLKNKVKELSVTQEPQYLLLNLLRTPIEVDGVKTNVAELIALWYINPDKYKEQLLDKISKILNDYYEGNIDFELEVKGKKSEILRTGDLIKKLELKLKTTAVSEAGTGIPLIYKPDEYLIDVTIRIYFNTVKENSWCYNPLAKACDLDRKKLCNCEFVGYKFVWTKCEECKKGCNPIEERCI